jgi:hypothetical protein
VKLARLEPRATAQETFSAFIDEGLDAVAGVRDVLEGFAKRRPGLRVMQVRFMAIPQARSPSDDCGSICAPLDALGKYGEGSGSRREPPDREN